MGGWEMVHFSRGSPEILDSGDGDDYGGDDYDGGGEDGGDDAVDEDVDDDADDGGDCLNYSS